MSPLGDLWGSAFHSLRFTASGRLYDYRQQPCSTRNSLFISTLFLTNRRRWAASGSVELSQGSRIVPKQAPRVGLTGARAPSLTAVSH